MAGKKGKADYQPSPDDFGDWVYMPELTADASDCGKVLVLPAVRSKWEHFRALGKGNELHGYCAAEIALDGRLLIYDVLLPEQECSAASVTISSAATAKFVQRLIECGSDESLAMRIPIHSHPSSVKPSYSSTDWRDCLEVDQRPAWTLEIVTDSSGRLWTAYFIHSRPLFVLELPVSFEEIVGADDESRWSAEFKECVKEKFARTQYVKTPYAGMPSGAWVRQSDGTYAFRDPNLGWPENQSPAECKPETADKPALLLPGPSPDRPWKELTVEEYLEQERERVLRESRAMCIDAEDFEIQEIIDQDDRVRWASAGMRGLDD